MRSSITASSSKHLYEQRSVQNILQGVRPPRYSVLYGSINTFNAQMTELKCSLSSAEVLRQLEDTHACLIEYAQRVPEEQFASETRIRRRLRLDSYSHYPIHTEAIRACRERLQRGS